MIQRKPFSPFGVGFPFSSIISAIIPGSGKVAEPGLIGVAPGSGVIICPPVSVCHQVSTIEQLPPPISL